MVKQIPNSQSIGADLLKWHSTEIYICFKNQGLSVPKVGQPSSYRQEDYSGIPEVPASSLLARQAGALSFSPPLRIQSSREPAWQTRRAKDSLSLD